MKKRIVLIEPRAFDLHIFSMYPLPRLGLLLLGTILKKSGWQVDVFVEERDSFDITDVTGATLVGISTITPTSTRAYAIADHVRKLGLPVVMGGPHVTYQPDEALDHADYVIRGEGETSLPLLAESLANGSGSDLKSIPGLSYRIGGKKFHNSPGFQVSDLDLLPAPDFSLLKSPLVRSAGQVIIPIQTSRGCPFDCSFCSVTGMFGRKYRVRSPELILEELSPFKGKGYHIFFYDDNFCANRESTKTLLEGIIKRDMGFTWSAQVRADTARDREFVKLMKRSGCEIVFLGLESVNEESLIECRKKQEVGAMSEYVKRFVNNGIRVHGMFMLGFDEDNSATARDTVLFAKEHNLSSAQFLILTPLPGTETHRKLTGEGRICFDDWALYDAHHVVFRPARMSIMELQKAQIESHKRFYSIRSSMKNLLSGRLPEVPISFYARRIIKKWGKNNKFYLKAIEVLSPDRNFSASLNLKRIVNIQQGPHAFGIARNQEIESSL